MTAQKAYKIFLNTIKDLAPEVYEEVNVPFDVLPESAKAHYNDFASASNVETNTMLKECINVVRVALRAENIFADCPMLQTKEKAAHKYTVGVLEQIIGTMEEICRKT